ncbi:class I SAM-dependent methyltransferase, partial [Flavobacteriaceae bacterium]|nr:class I SAM-dependent methyltransferase [Flavobacteriaceae bacterium]
MAFSKQWDSYYKRNNGSEWPWSDLISYFFQVEKYLQGNPKVLELGFGTGANIPFFLSKRIDYFGIEGSVSAVNRAKDLFPEFDKRIINGDFSKKINYFHTKFDLIFDRASVAHNNHEGIKKTIKLIGQNLNINGFYIGIDWFGDEHFEFTNGDFIDDIYTKKFKKKDYFGGFG